MSPRLRLPTLSLPRLPAAGTPVLLYILYTVVLFCIFLVANFPHHVLVQRALDEINRGPLRLDVRATRFAWWRGYELRGVQVRQADEALDVPPLFASRSVFVRPGLSGLLKGRILSASVSGRAYEGDISGFWDNTGGTPVATLELTGLRIGRYPLLLDLFEGGEVTGRLGGHLSFEVRGAGLAAGKADGELTLEGGGLTGARIRGMTTPDLHGCRGHLAFSAVAGRMDLRELQLDCEELKLSVSGQIVIRPRLPESGLNLRLQAEPGAAASAEWKVLVQLVPHTIGGTIAHPRYGKGAARAASGRRAR